MLADCLAGLGSNNGGPHKSKSSTVFRTDASNLTFERRFPKLIAHILQHDPDIITLCEVDHFECFKEALGEFHFSSNSGGGYDGVFAKKRTPAVDGVAIFWKRSRLDAVGAGRVIWLENDMEKEFMIVPQKENCAQVALLQDFWVKDVEGLAGSNEGKRGEIGGETGEGGIGGKIGEAETSEFGSTPPSSPVSTSTASATAAQKRAETRAASLNTWSSSQSPHLPAPLAARTSRKIRVCTTHLKADVMQATKTATKDLEDHRMLQLNMLVDKFILEKNDGVDNSFVGGKRKRNLMERYPKWGKFNFKGGYKRGFLISPAGDRT